GGDRTIIIETIGAVADQPSLAQFCFRARNRWVSGTQSRSTITSFRGVGSEMRHNAPFEAFADHPQVLCGDDEAPAPVEWILHALAACLTAGIANVSSARGVTLESVECFVEGDIDLRGILGLSDKVRNGFQAIRVFFVVKGDAPAAKLNDIVGQARARSAVYDILNGHVPIAIEVEV